MKVKEHKSINFNKTGAGNTVGKIVLPKKWLNDMGLNENDSWVELFYNETEKRIVIEKKKES